jgi:two-component system chemotaxis sensor kinase CheA
VDEPVAEDAGTQALMFLDLDDVLRAIPLAIVDRVEQVDTNAIRHAAGRLRLTTDGGILPLAALGDIGARACVGVLRLKDGENEIGYAIAEALDIIVFDGDIVPAGQPGPVAGAILVEGEQVELLDPHWLFAAHAGHGARGERPLCLVDPADGWIATFVSPMLEQAGYRVVTRLPAGVTADVAIAMEAGQTPQSTSAPVVHLSRTATGGAAGSVYRYDRAGILAALDSVAARTARR